MDQRAFLDAYLERCQAVFEQMVKDGSWPWADSRNPEHVLESEDNPHRV
jgi:hypothetical protein